MVTDKEAIVKAIEAKEACLAQLDEERRALTTRLQQLYAELQALDNPLSPTGATADLSFSEKILLFRNLFHGREDVFPKLWTSKAGRKGYAPACSNNLISGRCGKGRKSRIPCNECQYKNYIPVSDHVIRIKCLIVYGSIVRVRAWEPYRDETGHSFRGFRFC